MATIHRLPSSPWRAMIESAFYANSVRKTTMSELYKLSLKQPEVMATSHPFYKPEQFGRCIKSRDMFNYADSCKKHGKVIWLQKDPSLPPVCKVSDIGLAVASLSTMMAKGVEKVPMESSFIDPLVSARLVIDKIPNPI